jgi:hypothetical protein
LTLVAIVALEVGAGIASMTGEAHAFSCGVGGGSASASSSGGVVGASGENGQPSARHRQASSGVIALAPALLEIQLSYDA